MTGGIVVFFAIVAYLAYLGWKKTDTMSDFAIASERLGPYTLGAAFAATFFSAGTFVAYVSWSYQYGFSNLWIFIALLSASPIALIVFAKRVRRANIGQGSLSLPDWIGDFYNSEIMRVGVALVALFNIFYIAGQFSGGARAFQVMLGMDYRTAVTIVVAAVTLYVLVGGTYADVYTDAVQAILMAIMAAIVFLSVFWVFDSSGLQVFGEIGQQLAQQDRNLVAVINPESAVYYGGFAVFSIFFLEFAFSAQPQLFNKVLALNDPADLRKMIVTYILLTVVFLGVIFGGFYLRVLNPGVEAADQAVFLYVQEYFPPLIAAFLGVVVLAAALSTTDGIVVVLSTAVANDIFLKFLVGKGHINMEQGRADKIAHYIAMATVVAVGIVGFLIVLSPPPNLGILVWFGIAGVASGSVAPVLVGIYFPEFVTRKGAISSLALGALSYIVFSIVLFPNESVFVQGTYALLVSFGAMTVISAMTEQEDGVGIHAKERADTGTTAASDVTTTGDD